MIPRPPKAMVKERQEGDLLFVPGFEEDGKRMPRGRVCV